MFRTKLTFVNVTKRLLLAMVLVTTFLGCTKVIEPNFNDFGLQYYPTSLGDYRVYYTQTIRFNLNGSIDTTQYLVKELAEDSVVYSDGNARILLGRYSSQLGEINWQKDSIWAVLINNSNVIMSEANKDYVKLSFPVLENKKWDGNATNSDESEYYELIDLENPYTYDTLSFENTLTVVQKDLIDPAKITEDNYRIEVYAANIGLIHKLKIKINYCSNCIENGKIDDGFIFEQKLIEFGKE
ncbi:MAG: hypothetical protein L3J29_11670 [Cyclobacteriaceae bacterium]|nr:hypothetical protein [Cyclobacteriaceae bacterium]